MKKTTKRIILGNTDDFSSYLSRVNAIGSIAATSYTPTINFITALKNVGVWQQARMIWLCPKSPSNVATGALYIKPFNTVYSAILNNFVLGDFGANGLAGDGISKYADSGVKPADVWSFSSVSAAIYSHTTPLNANANDWGCFDGTRICQLNSSYSVDNNLYFDAGDAVVARISVANTNTNGLFLTQLNGTTISVSKNKIPMISSTVGNTPAFPDLNLYFYALNRNNTIITPSSMTYSFYALYNSALSDIQRDAQYDAYITYCTAIGRAP